MKNKTEVVKAAKHMDFMEDLEALAKQYFGTLYRIRKKNSTFTIKNISP